MIIIIICLWVWACGCGRVGAGVCVGVWVSVWVSVWYVMCGKLIINYLFFQKKKLGSQLGFKVLSV